MPTPVGGLWTFAKKGTMWPNPTCYKETAHGEETPANMTPALTNNLVGYIVLWANIKIETKNVDENASGTR